MWTAALVPGPAAGGQLTLPARAVPSARCGHRDTQTRPRPRERAEHTSVVPPSASHKGGRRERKGTDPMYARFKIVGIGLVIAGIAFVGVGGYTYTKTQAGRERARGVQRRAERQAQLQRPGPAHRPRHRPKAPPRSWRSSRTTGATRSTTSELNPNDPVVNTASEYMYQMATIAHHTLDGTQTVVLPEDVTADDGTVYKAGTYEVPVAGRYWSAFDRTQPDRREGSRAGLDRHGPRPHRRARCRQRDRLGPADRPRDRRPRRRPRCGPPPGRARASSGPPARQRVRRPRRRPGRSTVRRRDLTPRGGCDLSPQHLPHAGSARARRVRVSGSMPPRRAHAVRSGS